MKKRLLKITDMVPSVDQINQCNFKVMHESFFKSELSSGLFGGTIPFVFDGPILNDAQRFELEEILAEASTKIYELLSKVNS
jgi:hypothetical protein